MSLKKKTINGLVWSFVESFSKQIINFVIGLILARLLLPEEFGLIGMIGIFLAISISFIDSGFSQALIRKQNCTDVDYSTVFFFNLMAGTLLALILFFSAPLISNFFNQPQLIDIVRVTSLLLIIDSLTLIQKTKLTKDINFKLQTKISVISDVVSGIAAIVMAFSGLGVWSLVAKRMIARTINSALLWFWSSWRPIMTFSKTSFNELFGFGSKLLLSGLLNTVFNNIYLIVIGKYFSAADLGFYTQADKFKKLPSQNINSVIKRVTYPVLSEIQDDIPRLKKNYRMIIRSTVFITFTLMMGVAAVAEPLILTLIGEKWAPSIIYLQMLSFVGMMYPLHAINLNMLQVQGRSDLFLKLEIIKKILVIPVVVIGIIYGIKFMIIGMIINNIIAYYLNSYWSGRHIGYSIMEQLKDILPSLLLSFSMMIVVYLFGMILNFNSIVNLFIQILVGLVYILVIGELLQYQDYLRIKEMALDKLSKSK